jgi:putative restriction endonuclease
MVNHVERAYRAWPKLIECAAGKTTITYGQLGDFLGIHHRAVRYVLAVIQDYCLAEDYPPMTIMVVNGETHEPGPGFIAWNHDDLDRGRREVESYPWKGLPNPFQYASGGDTEEDLVDTLVAKPEASQEVYGRVKVRGVAQVIFRKALLRVYGCRCAFCGLGFEAALEACHLVPWNQASPQQRLDPRNGLLLCSTHHCLFDAGLMTVTRSGLVHYYDPKGKDGAYSVSDRAVTIALHGKKALLPRDTRLAPSEPCLARHHIIQEWCDLP